MLEVNVEIKDKMPKKNIRIAIGIRSKPISIEQSSDLISVDPVPGSLTKEGILVFNNQVVEEGIIVSIPKLEKGKSYSLGYTEERDGKELPVSDDEVRLYNYIDSRKNDEDYKKGKPSIVLTFEKDGIQNRRVIKYNHYILIEPS